MLYVQLVYYYVIYKSMIYYRGGLPISRSKTLSFNKKK